MRQVEKLVGGTELKQSEIERLNSKLRTVSSYNETLEKDIKDCREQVASLQHRLDTGQSESMKNVSAKNKADVVILDLRNTLQTQKDENQRILNDLAQSRKDHMAEKQKLENSNTQVERLRSLVENLD